MTIFSDPTFADIDFGFDHDTGDDYMSIMLGAYPDSIQVRRQLVMFPGMSGAWSKSMGTGPKIIAWIIHTWFKSDSAQAAFDAAIEAVLGGSADDLTFHGREYDDAVLVSYQPIGDVIPCLQTWAYAQRYLLQFEVLNP